MRCLQVLQKKVHAWVHFCALFPARRATEVHQHSQDLRHQQHDVEAVADAFLATLEKKKGRKREVQRLQNELDAANANLIRYACNEIAPAPLPIATLTQQQRPISNLGGNYGAGGGGGPLLHGVRILIKEVEELEMMIKGACDDDDEELFN
ncbi:hypothetical protein Sjap_016183 [Stephania japonica]|uniref:Uncharacterized protein n=1 Tax=Stephania japonica TaxID=461633 RepID=A0AAP0NUR5_9MAGN